jgi:hypothetical protein
MIKKLIKWFKKPKKQKTCFADADGMSHAGCASMPSCDKCSCYRYKL